MGIAITLMMFIIISRLPHKPHARIQGTPRGNLLKSRWKSMGVHKETAGIPEGIPWTLGMNPLNPCRDSMEFQYESKKSQGGSQGIPAGIEAIPAGIPRNSILVGIEGIPARLQ